MKRPLVGLLIGLASLGSLGWAQPGPAQTRKDQVKDQVIALAAEHPAFASLLGAHEGWQADAYATGNRYGIWRVQFFFPGGKDLGWADVSPVQKRVYAWEASYELAGELNRRAERALYRFVTRQPEVRALVGDARDLDRWFWYDSWREVWTVHLERGVDSLDIAVRSRNPGSLNLTELFIEKIYFPNVLGYGAYREAQRSSALALAFAAEPVAAALRQAPGWTSTGTALGDDRWQIVFSRDGAEVASAVVDLKTRGVEQLELAP